MSDALLVLVRHGQSKWNLKNKFTGWKNPDLSINGEQEAKSAGKQLKEYGISFDVAYTSMLKRAQNTLNLLLGEMKKQHNIPISKNEALNERDYGKLSGMNKDEARAKWGEDTILAWRRSYDIAPPGGESLKDTSERVIPYYLQHIQPDLIAGKNVLVVAHGNSLRALIMMIEKLDEKQIIQIEVNTGEPMIYRLNAEQNSFSEKTILSLNKRPEDENRHHHYEEAPLI